MSVELPVAPNAPPRSWGRDVLGFLVPLAILAVGAGVLAYSIINRPDQKTTPEEVVIPQVTTTNAIPFEESFEIDVDGIVVPHREVDLSTQVGGRIVHRAAHCRAGKYVKAGEVLFEIDPTDFELEVTRLEQEVQASEHKIHETEVDLEHTRELIQLATRDLELQELDVQRTTKLSRRGGVAQAEVDRSLREQVTAKNALQTQSGRESLLTAQLDSAKTAVKLARTKLEVARLDLSRTKIEAPIDGVIVEEHAEVDSFVQKGAMLVTIEDTSAVEVLCSLRTDQVTWLWRASGDEPAKIGGQYELPPVPTEVVYSTDGREYVWRGIVSRYDGIGLNPKTRTIPCRILVPNPTEVTSLRETNSGFLTEEVSSNSGSSGSVVQNGSANDDLPTGRGPAALVRGMFVQVRIQAPTAQADLLRVPVEAVRPGGTVWVVTDNKLDVRKVSVAKTLSQYVLLHRDGSDVGSDDQIVVTPLPYADEGMEVREVVAQ